MQRFSAIQYLKMDIAGNAGLDKCTWQQRLDWFEAHKDNLLDPLLIQQADNPALYYAGVKAYEGVMHGKVNTYPISLDATASGMQILACLTGDREAAKLCNVINRGEERADGYTIIFDEMKTRVDSDAVIERDMCKKAVMTALYGSKAMPRKVFGEGRLLDIFYETMADLAPAAWELNEHFLEIWDAEALINSWVLPDNFHVHVKVMSQVEEQVHFMEEPVSTYRNVNMPMEEGRSLGANTIHSIDGMIVREMGRRCMYDKKRVQAVKDMIHNHFVLSGTKEDNKMVAKLWKHYQDSGFLSARILDHINSNNLMLEMIPALSALIHSLPVKPFEVISIHDCFRCLPNYGNDLRWQYTNLLSLIAGTNGKFLSYLLTQITGKEVVIENLDETMAFEVIEANYALS